MDDGEVRDGLHRVAALADDVHESTLGPHLLQQGRDQLGIDVVGNEDPAALRRTRIVKGVPKGDRAERRAADGDVQKVSLRFPDFGRGAFDRAPRLGEPVAET